MDAQARVAAGNALAQQGDPRFRADAWYLPDEPLLGFRRDSARHFLMGSDKREMRPLGDELPQHGGHTTRILRWTLSGDRGTVSGVCRE
jgi:hypothetical protein